MMLPVVAVVGRPNVGKSTLVNRMIGRREAIVEEQPGVTRDRKAVEGEWRGRRFTIVDTGGWLDTEESLDAKVSEQADRAIADADVVLLVVDVAVGIVDEDERVAARLRGQDPSRVLVVVNKVDNEMREAEAWSFGRLGLGPPQPVSALQGRGAGDLLDAVVGRLPDERGGIDVEREHENEDENEAKVPGVAIVGRPNVGKSTLFNRLIGEDRAIVHDLPGTTRDAIDTVVTTPDGPVRFIDTAGMRRKSRVGEGAEYYSLVRALQAIDRSDAALLVVDSAEGVTHQDQRLAERIDAAGSPVVIVLNKWDLLDAEARTDVMGQMADRLHFLGYAPVLKVSARSGKGVHKLLPALKEAIDAYHRRVPTRELNQVLQAAQADHPAASGRVLYATQGATDPPTFTLFTNRALPAPYVRYLERRIREHFGFGPTPLKLRVRRRAG
jgi:GTP-binding protein